MVIDVSKKYLPGMSKGFDDPKLTLNIGDGFEFMKNHQEEFDVIITDSSDPIGEICRLTICFVLSFWLNLKIIGHI